jgi:hypothetical protein
MFFLFKNCRLITSNPPASLPPKTNESWGVCGWQKIGLERVNYSRRRKDIRGPDIREV